MFYNSWTNFLRHRKLDFTRSLKAMTDRPSDGHPGKMMLHLKKRNVYRLEGLQENCKPDLNSKKSGILWILGDKLSVSLSAKRLSRKMGVGRGAGRRKGRGIRGEGISIGFHKPK